MFKTIMLKIAIIVSFCILSTSNLAAQQFSFQSKTFLGNVRDIIAVDNKIWGVTSGGVLVFSQETNAFTILNNTSGLSSNNVSSVVQDTQNRLWLGMDDGSLNVINLENEAVSKVVIDSDPVRVNDIAVLDNSLYLAMDIGVSQFLIDKQEIKSTFRNLGSFISNTPVLKLYVADGKIWAATERGIATADIASPNLQDPQFWENFSVAEGLPSNTVRDFIAGTGFVLAATDNGVVRIVNDAVFADGLSGISVNSFTEVGGVIYAAALSGIYVREGAGSWTAVTPSLDNVNVLTGDENGLLWAGRNGQGLSVLNETGQEWVTIESPGPGGNSFEEMQFDSQDRLWVATGITSNNGVYMFDGLDWRHFTRDEGLVSNNTTGVAVDMKDRIWIGTPGQGLMILDMPDEDLSVTIINEEDGKLSGAVTESFVIVNNIIRGTDDVIWLVNTFADNGKAIVAVTPDDVWHYFSTNDGLVSTEIRDIAFDPSNRLWIAMEDDGVNVLDYRNTLSDKSDDIWTHLTISDGLSSDRIVSLAADKLFGMWIGTENGVDFIVDGLPIQRIFGTIDNTIASIAVDPANNKWLGTRKGISILAPDNFTFSHLTTGNSDLVDESIIHILVNDKDGKVYAGTGSGLSVISTPFKTSPQSFDEITVYPNPFILDGSATSLTIENLKLNSTVLIATISGNVIRTLTENGGIVTGTQAIWDGRDENNNLVPTGIYIIAAGVSGQGHGTQKVAVIRR